MRGCESSTGSRQGEMRLRNRRCDGQRSARHDPPSTVAQVLSSLDSNRLTGEASNSMWRVQSVCALKRGQQSICSPDVCFPESCHTGPCMSPTIMRFMSMPLLQFTLVVESLNCCLISVRQQPIIEQLHVAITTLMVFTHVCSVCTVPKTCRPAHTSLMKVRQWLSCLSHILTNTENCPACPM